LASKHARFQGEDVQMRGRQRRKKQHAGNSDVLLRGGEQGRGGEEEGGGGGWGVEERGERLKGKSNKVL